LAIDHGADAVLGHGPHVAQPIARYRERPIIYSLGNAVFDRDDARYSNGLLVMLRLEPGRATVAERLTVRLRQGRPLI
ncbi:MAG: CapA family protein, partial [Armatimonadetes bacterium]|nr:CapA family protein [Armatimonadota bacterium]